MQRVAILCLLARRREPAAEKVGKTASHGCIRLTNWDAMDLSRMVDKGTPVAFLDQ